MDFTKDDLELLAAGLLGGKQNLGQNLSQGLLLMRQGRTEREDRAQRQQAMQMQQEMQRMQLDQAKQAHQDQQNISGVLGQYFRPAQEQQTAPFQADTFPGEAPIQGLQTITQQARPAVADFQGASSALMGLGTPAAFKEGMQMMQYAQKQTPAPIKLGKGETLYDPSTGKPIFTAPDKEAETELARLIRERGNYDPETTTYKAYTARINKLGTPEGTTVNVNPPREVFKDSLTLKKDFDSQPEVKAFKEVQTAWDQISTALKNPSPANDMAAATKFMKLLDPGSVVRESELAMAMQATGKLDQFLNTANMIIKGYKLTPSQRKDFYDSANALYGAAKGRHDQTVGQYQGIAKEYNLDSRFLPSGMRKQSAQPSMPENDPLGIR